MERRQTGHLRDRQRSGIANGTRAEPSETDPSSVQSSARAIRYGLGLLLVALCVGLAAALFLTIGSAHAEVFLVGAYAAF